MALDPELESAYDIMVAMLRDWGLESLAPVVRGFLEDGRTSEQIGVLLQDTEEYKRRFAGNELRRQRNLRVLSPAEYLANEAAYRQIMESAGLPSGFYDSPDDFVEWIGNDVSPVEIQSRVQGALDISSRMDDDTARAFREFYGIERRDLAAFFLDRDRGLQELERISRAGLLGGAGRAQGVEFTRQRAERLAMSTLVDPGEFHSAAGRVGRLTRDMGRLSSIHGGTPFTQRQAEEDVFFSNEEARRRRRQLRAAEVSSFSQGSGASPDAFAQAVGQV